MKFTLSWLKDHLETDASLDEIVERLTMIGLEVESVDDKAALAPFVIAKVLTAEKHPDADKLRVLMVDTGAGDPVQVVCGAPNARAGLVGAFAAPGAYVPGIDVTLSVGKIRGVESRGMMCSERELQLSDEHTGIIDLPEDAPVGASFAAWAKLDDPVRETADIALMQDDIAKLPYVVRLARFTQRIIRANIALTFIVKALFLALAAAGLTTMWLAIFADVGMSLMVTLNGMRPLRWKQP